MCSRCGRLTVPLSPQLVSAALFNQHKLCFAFLLCTAIMKNNSGKSRPGNDIDALPEEEWNIFLYSNLLINTEGVMPQPQLDGKSKS